MTAAFFLQAWLMFTGGAAVWLTANPGSRHHLLGCWIGLAGQPAWFFTAWQHGQWGVFLLSIVFATSFVRGIVVHHRRSRRFPTFREIMK